MDLLCDNDECENEATTRYRWPWGDEGVVCDDHRGHTAQLAQQLGRDVSFTSLVTEPAARTPDLSTELTFAKSKLLQFEEWQNAATHTIEELRAELATSKREAAEAAAEHERVLTNLRAEMARRAGGVRAAQVDSDVEAATASTGPTESPRETQSQPKAPRR